ncbi:hypothetical protein ABZ897_28455 [Nonomuraea sp. NPDC046802]|uniref:hypothetical protein n=1 Tax=Nonomuraea sp. NPDC046802 TaxID=3154919 RepID=UPI0034054C16
MTTSGDASETPRPLIGRAWVDRPRHNNGEYDRDAQNVEDGYADYLANQGFSQANERNMLWVEPGENRPGDPTPTGMGIADQSATAAFQKFDANRPTAMTDPEGDSLLAEHPINQDAVQKKAFIDLKAYEDPATGAPVRSSPLEELRRNLEGLQDGRRGLTELLRGSGLEERDLGTWQAARDLRMTTDQAHLTLGNAIKRALDTYSAVIEAYNENIKTLKEADKAAARGLGK